MAAFYVIKWFAWSEKPQHTADWKILHDPTKNDASETKLYSIQKNYQVTDPTLDMVMNEPGELTFTVPPTHAYYSNLKSAGIRICVAVFRDGSFLWGGHPLTIDEDLYGSLTYSCEGVLGWLSDVIAPTFSRTAAIENYLHYFINLFYRWGASGASTEESIPASACYRLFSALKIWSSIAESGKEAASSTDMVSRNTEKNLTVMELLKTRLLDYFGGYFEVGLTEENQSWLDDPDEAKGIWTFEYKAGSSSNTIALKVGENIQSLTRTTDYTDFCTALVITDSDYNRLLSESIQAYSNDYGNTYNCYKLANSPMLIHKDLSEKYGVIAKYVEAEEDEDLPVESYLADLLQDMTELAEPESIIEVEATDTTLVTGNYLHVGDKISYTDAENNEYADMVIEELEIDLDDPTSNKITLNGTLETLSKKVK